MDYGCEIAAPGQHLGADSAEGLARMVKFSAEREAASCNIPAPSCCLHVQCPAGGRGRFAR